MRNGAHHAVDRRVSASGAVLRGHVLASREVRGVRGGGAGGGRGGTCGGAPAALRRHGGPLALAAGSLTLSLVLRLFGHVLHDLLRHLDGLKAHHVEFQEAVQVLLVSGDTKQTEETQSLVVTELKEGCGKMKEV